MVLYYILFVFLNVVKICVALLLAHRASWQCLLRHNTRFIFVTQHFLHLAKLFKSWINSYESSTLKTISFYHIFQSRTCLKSGKKMLISYIKMESEHLCNKKQGLKLVLSDALVVQSEGLRVSRSKVFKSQGCFGISKKCWHCWYFWSNLEQGWALIGAISKTWPTQCPSWL